MRTSPLPADFIHARACKPICEKYLTLPVQELLPEIEAMLGSGKTQREVAEYFGFRDKYVVKSLVKRERAKQRKREAGITIRPKGRPRKAASPRDIVAEQAYEIQRLRMENELLRDFLQSIGRK